MGWGAGREWTLTLSGPRKLAPFPLLSCLMQVPRHTRPHEPAAHSPAWPPGNPVVEERSPVILQGHRFLLLVIPGTVPHHPQGQSLEKEKPQVMTRPVMRPIGHAANSFRLWGLMVPITPHGDLPVLFDRCVNSYIQILFPVLFPAGNAFLSLTFFLCQSPVQTCLHLDCP